MAILREAVPRCGNSFVQRRGRRSDRSRSGVFAALRVEKWPVWLSFLRSAELVESDTPLGPGSEVGLRSAMPGDPDQLFEVDHFVTNHRISLVGAYSVRRRLDFRLERKTSRCKLHGRARISGIRRQTRHALRWSQGRTQAGNAARRIGHAFQASSRVQFEREGRAVGGFSAVIDVTAKGRVFLLAICRYTITNAPACQKIVEVRHGFDDVYAEPCRHAAASSSA